MAQNVSGESREVRQLLAWIWSQQDLTNAQIGQRLSVEPHEAGRLVAAGKRRALVMRRERLAPNWAPLLTAHGPAMAVTIKTVRQMLLRREAMLLPDTKRSKGWIPKATPEARARFAHDRKARRRSGALLHQQNR